MILGIISNISFSMFLKSNIYLVNFLCNGTLPKELSKLAKLNIILRIIDKLLIEFSILFLE